MIDALERLLDLLTDNSEDDLLAQSLWTAALIGYARSFSKGKRLGLSESLFDDKGLEGDPVGCHRHYVKLRDKYTRRSASPFGRLTVGLVLAQPDSPKREVLGVAALAGRPSCPETEEVEILLALTLVARNEVAKEAKEHEDKTLDIGKGVPIDTLYKKAKIRTVALELQNV